MIARIFCWLGFHDWKTQSASGGHIWHDKCRHCYTPRAKQISDDLDPLPASVNSLLPTFYPAHVKFQVEFNRLARCMPMAYEDFTEQVFRQLCTGRDPMEALDCIVMGETL